MKSTVGGRKTCCKTLFLDKLFITLQRFRKVFNKDKTGKSPACFRFNYISYTL